MKKNSTVKSFMLKAVEKTAVKSTESTANSACFLWQYQPKESANVKKMRKF